MKKHLYEFVKESKFRSYFVCTQCGKKIAGSRGMKAHARWHVKNGDAEKVVRERISEDSFAVFPDGTELGI